MKAINRSSRPQVLDDGTIIGAGESRSITSLSARDRRRLVLRGIIALDEQPAKKTARREVTDGAGARD